MPMPSMREGVQVKYLLDELGVEADGLEDLGAAIALDGGDAHLGGDLEDAFDGGLDVILEGLLAANVLEQALADQVVEGLERQVGIDGADAVADQQGEMMHLARFARFEHQAGAGAGAGADQVMVQAGDREQRRDGRVLRVNAAVGQDQDVGAAGDRLVGLARRAPQAPAPGRRRLRQP